MVFWFKQREQEYEVCTAPDGEGFTGIVSRVRREDMRVLWRAEWTRLDLPRPTRRLAQADAQALAAALLDQSDADAAAARGEPSTPPHVTAEQILEYLRVEGFSGIGDGLYRHLGQPVPAYYYGFERALQDLQPPKEIPASATIYWAGYRDGEAAHPKLLDAGVISKEWGSRSHWRDLPYHPSFERSVLTDRDLFADYTIDLLRTNIQPVYEPGYPPAEGEIRDTQVLFLYHVTALLHERPLPRSWLRSSGPDRVPDDDFGPRFSEMLGLNRRRKREYTFPQRDSDRTVPGQCRLVEMYEEPEHDVASALTAMRQTVGSAVALLEEFRGEAPDAFVDDPVTVTLQQRAAELRYIGAKGPTQIPEITDEQVTKVGEQGPGARQSVRDWNEHARQGYERRMAELPLLEAQLHARGADPFDTGGWAPR
jgi:hypothetical protein